MFRTSLTEKTKLEIARLYQTTDIPIEAIATQLNVSASSVHRFKDYGYSTKDESKEQPQVMYPEKKQDFEKNQNKELYLDDRNKHYSDDKIVFIGGKKHHEKNTKKPQDNEDHDPQDHEESGDENENNTTTKEEMQQEFEWECPGCHHQWNGYMLECPDCGMKLQE